MMGAWCWTPDLIPGLSVQSCMLLNPVTAKDDYSCHQNLAAHYQLVQSVLKIGSPLAETGEEAEVGGYHPPGDSAWWLWQWL